MGSKPTKLNYQQLSPLIAPVKSKPTISLQDIINVNGNKRAFFFSPTCDRLSGYQDAKMNSIKMQVFLSDRGFQCYIANEENSIESELGIFFSSLISGDIIFIYYCGAGGITSNSMERYALEDGREVSGFDLILAQNLQRIPASCLVMIFIDDGCKDTVLELPHKLECHDGTFRTIHYLEDPHLSRTSVEQYATCHLYIKFEASNFNRMLYGNFFTKAFLQKVQQRPIGTITWKEFISSPSSTQSIVQLTVSTNMSNLADYEMTKVL